MEQGPTDVGTIRRVPVQGLTQGNQDTVRGGASAELTDESAAGRAITLIPSGFNPASPFVVLLHLHGYTNYWTDKKGKKHLRPYAGWRERKGRNQVRDVAHDQLAQQIEAGGDAQVVGVLPQGGEESQFGADYGLRADDYIKEVLTGVSAQGELTVPPVKAVEPKDWAKWSVVLSAHSGGGHTVRRMLEADLHQRTGTDPVTGKPVTAEQRERPAAVRAGRVRALRRDQQRERAHGRHGVGDQSARRDPRRPRQGEEARGDSEVPRLLRLLRRHTYQAPQGDRRLVHHPPRSPPTPARPKTSCWPGCCWPRTTPSGRSRCWNGGRRGSTKPARYRDFLAHLTAVFDRAGTPVARTGRPGPGVAPGLLEPLSTRELEVLTLVAAGQANREIAQQLYITVDTVKRHVSHIFDKLDAANRTQAVARARELGLLDTR